MVFPRTSARIRRLLFVSLTIACFALLGAVVFVLGVVAHSLGSVPHGRRDALLQVAGLFALLGALLGSIVALDRSTGLGPRPLRVLRTLDAPLLRTAFGAVIGGAIVLLVGSWRTTPFPAAWALIGALVGALLGWAGWRWARYVDF